MDVIKKLDPKTAGLSVGGSVLAFFLLQDRGIEFMNTAQDAQNTVVEQKINSNTMAIKEIREDLGLINSKIELGFKGISREIGDEVDKINQTVYKALQDRYTKSEFNLYSEGNKYRLDRIEQDIQQLKTNNPRGK